MRSSVACLSEVGVFMSVCSGNPGAILKWGYSTNGIQYASKDHVKTLSCLQLPSKKLVTLIPYISGWPLATTALIAQIKEA